MRGDVPAISEPAPHVAVFSPHARGCSETITAGAHLVAVFPACAGMFLKPIGQKRRQAGFPRMRGDVPAVMLRRRNIYLFSPHARGCSDKVGTFSGSAGVFPACAGMFRLTTTPPWGRMRFPRMRGDVPAIGELQQSQIRFSPHARGCSGHRGAATIADPVFPACAGMFRFHMRAGHTRVSFPRMRGDVPRQTRTAATRPGFSPHARGCS